MELCEHPVHAEEVIHRDDEPTARPSPCTTMKNMHHQPVNLRHVEDHPHVVARRWS